MNRLIYDEWAGEERAVFFEDNRPTELFIQRHLTLNLGEIVRGHIISYHPTLRGYFIRTDKEKDVFVPTSEPHTEGETVYVRITKEARSDKDASGVFSENKHVGCPPLKQVLETLFPEEKILPAERDEIDTVMMQALADQVRLQSGGTLHFEQTHVCHTVDVDTSSSRGQWHQINTEAVSEILRHLRLRHIGGLTLIDFAGTKTTTTRRSLDHVIQEAAKADHMLSIGGWTRSGLYELKRRRERSALADLWNTPENAFYRICRAVKDLPHALCVHAHPKVVALLERVPYISAIPDFGKDINAFEIKEKP